ncbi:MAG TPA: succinate dehydrogenase, cytochrome b556 subunit [Stellaceae bacterium]|jgi:succinate dehydrogenase / fumarate reductase cytochrome b subunit|nr:succinate dehydrogenase, cytochrome b556 subunit [Stellaceae bacterium]
MTEAERPLSPHLQIYKPQLTSMLSISHRATGLALSIGTVFLVWWLVAAATGDAAFAAAQWFFGSWLGLLFLFAWAFSFFFHLCNGIRHLVWDAGYGFEIRTAYASGWTVVAASAVLTVVAFIAGLAVRG